MKTLSSALLCLGCILLAVACKRGSQADWPTTAGHVSETRIVVDHANETKWGSDVSWKAEYHVVYSVGGRQYDIWRDSGVRGASDSDVRVQMPRVVPSCRVQYNPDRPEISAATC